jgi:hypothetical protein
VEAGDLLNQGSNLHVLGLHLNRWVALEVVELASDQAGQQTAVVFVRSTGFLLLEFLMRTGTGTRGIYIGRHGK